MNLDQYEKETQRTFAYRQSMLDTKTLDLLHCAIGISTEAGELLHAQYSMDKINIGEEIADQMWYASNMLRFIERTIDEDEVKKVIADNMMFEPLSYVNTSVQYASELLDLFKKHIYYGTELSYDKIYMVLVQIVITLYDLCKSYKLDMNKLLDNNINKLRIRFPEKFTQELAENRDLGAERKELEK